MGVRKRGRPSKGITDTHVRAYVALSPEIMAQLKRLADRREQETHKPTSQADIIREAITQYLEQV